MTRRILRFVFGAAACVACAACEILSAPGSAGINGHGPLISGYQVLAYDWAADSRTIYFTAATGDGNRQVRLWGVDASNGRVRTVVSTIPGFSGMWQAVHAVKPAGAPEKLYVALTQDASCFPATIFRLPTDGGRPDTLATDVDNGAFATSDDGSHVAFTAVVFPAPGETCPPGRDSLVVMATSSVPLYDRRAVVRGLSWNQISPLSVSSSGALVYGREFLDGGTYTVIRLVPASGGPPRELIRLRANATDTIHALSPDIVWRGDTPTLLMTRVVQGRAGVDVYAIDGASGARTLEATIPGIAPTSVSRSADGTTWVGWFAVEDLTPHTVEAHKLRYQLVAKRASDPDLRILAEVEGLDRPGKVRVSPDGRRVSFVKGELYVFEIP